jgi:hypothetical protein
MSGVQHDGEVLPDEESANSDGAVSAVETIDRLAFKRVIAAAAAAGEWELCAVMAEFVGVEDPVSVGNSIYHKFEDYVGKGETEACALVNSWIDRALAAELEGDVLEVDEEEVVPAPWAIEKLALAGVIAAAARAGEEELCAAMSEFVDVEEEDLVDISNSIYIEIESGKGSAEAVDLLKTWVDRAEAVDEQRRKREAEAEEREAEAEEREARVLEAERARASNLAHRPEHDLGGPAKRHCDGVVAESKAN